MMPRINVLCCRPFRDFYKAENQLFSPARQRGGAERGGGAHSRGAHRRNPPARTHALWAGDLPRPTEGSARPPGALLPRWRALPGADGRNDHLMAEMTTLIPVPFAPLFLA